jgi:triacylglycerol esterase/lipase EstA (alpha/beta hydrolase family)
VVRQWPEVQKISFVAHSLGGLVARYAIGRLYDNSSKLERVGTSISCFNEEKTEYSKQCLKQICEAKIAGLEPMNFITFATPHLGSRGNNQVLFYEP